MTKTETTATTEKKERKKRASLEEFMIVCLEAANKEEAAARLRLTVSSFDQRLRKEKQRYKDHFQLIDTSKFFTGRVGRTPPTPNEAWNTLAKIKGVSVEELKKEIQSQEQEVTVKQEAPVAAKPARTRTSKKSK